MKLNHPKLIQSYFFFFFFYNFLFAPGFINVHFPLSGCHSRPAKRAATKVPLSVAFHGLVPLQLINGMKSPTQHLAATATFASCQIGETWTGKISPGLGLFKVISFDACSSQSLLPVHCCHHRLPRAAFTWGVWCFTSSESMFTEGGRQKP